MILWKITTWNEESLEKKNLVYQQNKELWVRWKGRETSLMKQKNIGLWVLWNTKTDDIESYENIKQKMLGPMKT